MEKEICVFCASSTRVHKKYHDVASEFASLLVENGFAVKYGAGSVGLMGTLAKTVLEKNGRVVGVIPQFMVEMEWANKDIDELIVVDDMHERKKLMIKNVEAVVALAGGIGTLDELVEVITLKQLGQFSKPVVIVNTEGFYDNLLAQLNDMVNEGFMCESHKQNWHVAENPTMAFEAIKKLKETDQSVIFSAQV